MTTELIRAEGGFKEWHVAGVLVTSPNASTAVDVFKTTSGSWQVVWDGLDSAVSGEMQASHDGTHWDTIDGSEFTTSGASGSVGAQKSNVPGGFVQLAITATTATTGTIDLFMNCKEDNEG